MKWLDIFHRLIIPFLGGFALTLAKLIADHKPLSFEEANDIALDMVLLGVCALGAFYIKGGTVESVINAGVGDVFLAAVLLYLRYERKCLAATAGVPGPVRPLRGIIEMLIGAGAIFGRSLPSKLCNFSSRRELCPFSSTST